MLINLLCLPKLSKINNMKKKSLILLVFFFGFLTTYSQDGTIKGKVSDNTGIGLPGANIAIKGTKSVVSTDLDGNFQIKATRGNVLVVSYIGFANQEVTVSGNTLNVVLREGDANKLEEVVITAFNVQSKTKSLGFANQTIKAADIERPGQVNALESLQGSISGLTVNKTSGAAGAGVDILIRGVSSLSAGSNNQPLIIIDGNPVNNSTFTGNVNPSIGSNSAGSSEQFAFSNRSVDINPNDIESYSVLKGAGATALYGILAGNGVIIITTKKGKEGKTKVNVSSSVSFSEINKYPELQSTWREGTTAGNATSPFPRTLVPRVLSNDADTVPGGVSYYPGFTSGFQSNGPKYSSSDDPSIRFRDFYKDFFKTGVNHTLNVSVSGGNEKINYYLSASTSKDEGTVPNTSYDRKTLKFNGGYKLLENLKIGTSVTYANSGGTRANTGDKSIMSSMSYWSPSIDINNYITVDGKQRNWTKGTIDNPRYFAEISNLNDNVDRWIAGADLNWQAKPWLSVVYRASIDNYSELRNRYVPDDLDVGTGVKGFITNETINFKGLNSNLVVTAAKKFGDISTTLLIGQQISDTRNTYGNQRGEGLLISGFNNISNTTNKFVTNTGEQVQRNIGYFGEAKVDYKEMMYLGATARRDEVSTLPKANRAFDYFSTNASFVFGDLIDKDRAVLSLGKLRASWAEVGKIPPYGIGRYSRPETPFNGIGGISIGSIGSDPNIRPEIVTTLELGTDLKFFNNRLRLEYTYFDRKSDDQIIAVPVSQISGLTSIWSNAGSLKTQGHELTVAGDILKSSSVKWTATANFTAYDTEVTALPFENVVFMDSFQGVISQVKVGDAAGSLYGYTWTKVDGQRLIGSNGLPVLKKTDKGDFEYSKVANAFPDWVATLNNTFTYKNFNLSFLFEYKEGGSAFDSGQRNGLRNGVLKITEERNIQKVLDGVKSDGAGGYIKNDIPAIIDANSYYRNENYNRASEILVQDASWLKLRNVSLSYNLPSELLRKLNIATASFTLSGSNFLLWTPFRGFDPEGSQFSSGSNVYGFTGLNVPLTQSYSFGVNFGF